MATMALQMTGATDAIGESAVEASNGDRLPTGPF